MVTVMMMVKTMIMVIMLLMMMVKTIMLHLAGDWKGSPATGAGDNCQGSVVTGGPLQKYILMVMMQRQMVMMMMKLIILMMLNKRLTEEVDVCPS